MLYFPQGSFSVADYSTLVTTLYINKYTNIFSQTNTVHNISSFVPQFLQKRKSNQKQPSCKKRSAALEKAMVKKDVKSKVVAKKWL